MSTVPAIILLGRPRKQSNRSSHKLAARTKLPKSSKMALIPHINLTKYHPKYSPDDLERANEWEFYWSPNCSQDANYKYTPKGWIYNKQGKVLIPEHLMEHVKSHIYQSTHFRREATLQWIQKFIIGPNMHRTIQKVILKYMICAKNNPKMGPP